MEPEPAPVVPVKLQRHIKSQEDRNTTDSHTRTPSAHEKEGKLFAADMPDQGGNQGIANDRDEYIAQRDSTEFGTAGLRRGRNFSGLD